MRNFCEKKCKPQIEISEKYMILNQQKRQKPHHKRETRVIRLVIDKVDSARVMSQC